MKDPTQTFMYAEASQASEVAALQYASNAAVIGDLAKRLRALAPQIIFTCARGSSDHAATYAKYLIETRLRIPVVSQAPSISSIYGAPLLHMQNQPFIVISQSGKSPDLLLSAEAARKAGALVIALVNDIQSPLADVAEIVVPLHAGPEKSVAATKSYIATLCALAHLVGEWTQVGETQQAVTKLPDMLKAAWADDWSAGAEMLSQAQSMFILGRGLTLGIAQEAALKFKETSGIHAEAFSMAEVVHGPMALVKPGFPLLIFPPTDQAAAGLESLVQQFLGRDAAIAVAGRKFDRTVSLGIPDKLDNVIAPIAMVQSFYAMVNAISVQRGFDPDRPPLLRKVTETI